MGSMFGYIANRSHPLRDILYQERRDLNLPEDARVDAYGLSFNQGDEVLHLKKPTADGERIDWVQLVGDIKTDCAIGHARSATVGDFRTENTHPFRFRRWMFAHTGTVPGFDIMRNDLRAKLPELLSLSVRGETDSEHMFYLVLSMLYARGLLDVEDPPHDAVIESMKEAAAVLKERCQDAGQTFSQQAILITNGRSMYGYFNDVSVVVQAREGLDSTPPQRTGVNSEFPKLPPLRYVLTSVGFQAPDESKRITEGYLVVDRALRVQWFE